MEGSKLVFEKNGIMYKYGKTPNLNEANLKSVGGKTFKSLKAALDDMRANLKKEASKKED